MAVSLKALFVAFASASDLGKKVHFSLLDSENRTHLFSNLKKVLVIRKSTGFLYMGHSESGENGSLECSCCCFFKEMAVLVDYECYVFLLYKDEWYCKCNVCILNQCFTTHFTVTMNEKICKFSFSLLKVYSFI